MKNKNIVVWFSCGAASAVAAKLTILKYGKFNKVNIVNNPVKEEHPDNIRFLKDVEKWLSSEILFAVNRKYESCSIKEVFDKRKYMSGVNGASCTLELKKEARKQYETKNNIDFHVLGFTFDELERHNRFIKYERSNLLPILIDNQISKSDCFKILDKAGIKIPEIYSLGFPNANCIGCVKATSPTYWNLVRKEFPNVFEERQKQSKKLGVKLARYRGKRVFLDELPVDAKGHKIKSYDCGIFCETK